MSIKVSLEAAQEDFASLCDEAAAGEVIYIRRRGKKAVAMVAAAELSGLMETVYLFASPKNGMRLLSAMERARSREGSGD